MGQRNLRRTSRFRQVREFWWAVLFLGGVLLDHGCYCTSTPWNELCRSGFRHGCACSQPPEKNRDKQRNQTQLWRVKKLKNLKSTHRSLLSSNRLRLSRHPLYYFQLLSSHERTEHPEPQSCRSVVAPPPALRSAIHFASCGGVCTLTTMIARSDPPPDL